MISYSFIFEAATVRNTSFLRLHNLYITISKGRTNLTYTPRYILHYGHGQVSDKMGYSNPHNNYSCALPFQV